MATVVCEIAGLLAALRNCETAGRADYAAQHKARILEIIADRLPSGSGFDNGVTLDFDKSRRDRLIFVTDFHHMDEYGYYCGWSHHNVIVTPSFIFGADLRVTGRNRDCIKDYIGDTFAEALSRNIAKA